MFNSTNILKNKTWNLIIKSPLLILLIQISKVFPSNISLKRIKCIKILTIIKLILSHIISIRYLIRFQMLWINNLITNLPITFQPTIIMQFLPISNNTSLINSKSQLRKIKTLVMNFLFLINRSHIQWLNSVSSWKIKIWWILSKLKRNSRSTPKNK